MRLRRTFLVFLFTVARCVCFAPSDAVLNYNTTVVWKSFFEQFPALWTSITTALNEGETADLSTYASQIQGIFQKDSNNAPITSSSPAYATYQSQVRRALLDIGLPGTAATTPFLSQKNVSYEMQAPLPIFVSETGSLVGEADTDPTWFLGPHICITRTSAFNQSPDPIRNVTFCISSRNDIRMNIVCWLPTLGTDGVPVSGTTYTTYYRCCDGYSLPPAATDFPPNATLTLADLDTQPERISAPDNRVCQQSA